MKTNKKSISLLLALVMFLSAFALSGTYAENEIVEDEFIEDLPVEEEKIFCQATLEDDFADDRVTVVLKNKQAVCSSIMTKAVFRKSNAQT